MAVLSIFEYAIIVGDPNTKTVISKFDAITSPALRFVTNAKSCDIIVRLRPSVS